MTRIGIEARLEDECRRRIRRKNGRCIKIIGDRGDPDRLVTLPGGVLFFCEFKRPGERPNELQKLRIAHFREMGFVAGWVDSLDGFFALLDEAERATRPVQCP